MSAVSYKSYGIKPSYTDRVFDMVTFALLGLVFIIVIYPLYFIVIASISDPVAVNSGMTLLAPKKMSLICYSTIFNEKRIWMGYANTILYTVCGTVFALFVTIPAGYALSRDDLPFRSLIMKYFVFTMFFSGGLIPTYLVVKNLGLVNTRYVLIILGAVNVTNIIITRTFFATTIPKELIEAAYMDGCNNTLFFMRIVLPVSKAIIAVIMLYVGVAHWNAFFNGLIYLNQQKLYPLQLVLRDLLLGSAQITLNQSLDPEAASEAQRLAESIKYGVIIVSSLPVLIIYPFLQKYFVQGVLIGSVKG